MNLISQHIQETKEELHRTSMKSKADVKVFTLYREVSLVEKIIGQARAMKRTDETQMSADHSYDEGLEDLALLLEQGLKEIKQ